MGLYDTRALVFVGVVFILNFFPISLLSTFICPCSSNCSCGRFPWTQAEHALNMWQGLLHVCVNILQTRNASISNLPHLHTVEIPS